MARIRTIKPEFFTDEEVGELAPLDRLFFIGLWCHADKAGRMKDKPRQLKVQILPYDRYNVTEGLAKLIEMRFLVRYVVDGESYLQIRTWLAHQRPHHTERDSTYPACSNGELTVEQPLDNSESEEGKEGKGREGNGKEGSTDVLDKIDFPDGFDTPEVRTAIADWLAYKQGRGQPYKQPPNQMGRLLKRDWVTSPAIFVSAVDHSIAQNYQGVFPSKDSTHGKQPRPPVGQTGRIHQRAYDDLPETRASDVGPPGGA